MNVKEIPVVFECEQVQLVGIIHVPERPFSSGVLAVAAGGVQYRAGCGRQLLSLARTLASQGTPVMRFDHRGMGDSVGELLGFEHIELDLRRAIERFKDVVPALEHIVLFGGCEAASGIMISAYKLPSVKSVILANPWVNDSMHAVVTPRHYYRKLLDLRFWKKLITFQYSLTAYANSFMSYAKERISSTNSARERSTLVSSDFKAPFQQRMLSGFQQFGGSVLFLKSGLSLISEEFDYLVAHSKPWSRACSRPSVKRIELPSSDQTFSTAAARREISGSVIEWMCEVNNAYDTSNTSDTPLSVGCK